MRMPPLENPHDADAIHSRPMRARPPRHGATRALPALLLATIMVVSILSGTALAVGGPPDGAGPGDEGSGPGGPGPGPRYMDVDVEPHRAQVRARLMSGQDGDEIGYDLEAQNQLTVQLQFRSQGDSAQNEVRMTLTFQQIVEFEDADGDGELDAGDEVVSTYDLEDAEYGAFQHQTRKTMDGKDEEVITGGTSDGVFRMVSHFAGEDAQIQSGGISPNWMKMDLLIEGYPYQRTTTQLALRTRLEAQGPVSVIHDPLQRAYMADGEGAVECVQEGVTSFYSWKRSADVDGVDTPVKARVSVEEGGTFITYSYQQGDSINHDPKLGLPLVEAAVDEVFDIMEGLVPYGVAVAIGAVVIGLSVHARRQRNGAV